MDADEEDFVFYGTPIGREEETSFRKRKAAADAGQLRTLPPWKQEVRDEEGRRRFHGAFTGGFSAGYYNTVGSKEGWAPQTFTSSRKSRAEVKQQNVYNFLDDDEREELDGRALETSSKFDTFGFTAAELSRKQAEKDLQKRPSVIPGPIPDELVTPAMNSIGVKLLVKMGWRHGHSIDKTRTNSLYDSRREARKAFLAFSGNEPKSDLPASYASRLESEASVEDLDDDAICASQSTPVFVLNPKQNLHGLGYDPFKHAPEFSERKRSLHTSRRKDTGSRSTASRKGNLFSSNSGKLAPGFGIGALEELDIEDEDIYDSGFEVVETCIDEVEPPSRTGKDITLLLRDKERTSLSGFMRATNSDYTLERFQPPDVPPGFKPQHKFPAPLDTSLAYHDSPPSEVLPPDDNNLRIMVEGFAALVSRCGKLFEDLSREKNKYNPLFCFLSGGNGYDYYARKLWEEKHKRADQKKLLMDTKSSSAQKMTAEVRGRALGEKPLEKSTTNSVSSLGLPEVHLQSNLSDNFTDPSSHIAFSEISKPFKNDPAKQERFEQFLKDKFEGGFRSSSGGTSRWSENDRARERVDFEAILESMQKGSASDGKSNLQSRPQKPVFPTISEAQFVSAGLEMVHAKSEENASPKNYPKREEFQWRPAPILCKRFDIIDPFLGKPPPLPRPRSKMESFVFTSDFIKSEKVEEKAAPAISSLQSDSRLNNIQQQTMAAEPDIETNEKAVHKPVDLYKAIFSDDSDDDDKGIDDGDIRKIDDPEKKIEGANTTLNRLVAGDFLESLGKELGLAIPTSAAYPAKKTIEMQGNPTVGNDGKVPSDCLKVGPISGAFERDGRTANGRLISSSGEEIDEQVGRHITSSDKNAAIVTSKGNGPDVYIEQMNVNAEERIESLTKRQKNHLSHKVDGSSTSDSDLSGRGRSHEHRKGKDKKEKTKHKSKRKRSRLRHRDSSLSDSDYSRHHGSVDQLDAKVARDNKDSSKKHRTHRRHQEDAVSDSDRFSDGERYNGGSGSKADKKSSKVENRKHSRHHRNLKRSSPDWSQEEVDRKERRSGNHQGESNVSKSDRYRQHR